MAFAKKLVAFAHYDFVNRMRVLNQRPIYGLDLIDSVRVNLLFMGDLHGIKRHSYVDRKAKFCKTAVNECFKVPSSVFN